MDETTGAGGARSDTSRPATTDDLQWQVSYDRASVDRYLVEVEAERSRLQAAIEVAQAQRDAALHTIAVREAEAQAELGALVLATQGELERIEASHQEIIDTIRHAAETEAARVLAAAHREVEAMRKVTASLGGRARRGDTPARPLDRVDPPAAGDRSVRDRADAG